MTLIMLSWKGNLFDGMSEQDREIINLALNLTAMSPDHPGYKKDSKKLDKLLKERDAREQVISNQDGQGS